METQSITVAVPVKDRRDRMLRCLESLLAQDYPAYEVLVLDNGSTDGTPEACRELAAAAPVPVRVEVLDGNHGSLRNQAVRLSGAELIAFTDSDCVADPRWLARAATRFAADPGLGVVQGRTLPEPGAPDDGWPATIEIAEWSGRYETCNLVVRRRAHLDGDGFHEGVATWEDTAGGASIVRAGWRAVFEPDALVHHDVTHPGYLFHLRKVFNYGDAGAVVRLYPELRDELLYAHWFLRSRNAKVLAAVAGVALAPLDRRALALAVPYAWYRRPVPPTPAVLKGTAQAVLYDLVILAGMVRGSIRHRALVL